MPMWGTELEKDDGAPFRAHAVRQPAIERQRVTPLLAPSYTNPPEPVYAPGQTEARREHGLQWAIAADELYPIAVSLRLAMSGARTQWAQRMLEQLYHEIRQRYRFARAQATRYTATEPIERAQP
jgi:hypothetical protein